MKEQDKLSVSRRGFIGATAAVAASTVLPQIAIGAAKPDSKFNGVQIGTITYSYRGLPGTAEDILKYIVKCGISSVELMGGPVEQFAGMPAGGRIKKEMTDDQKQAEQQKIDAQLKWRLSVSMDKFVELRKMFNDAGVNIHIVKFGDIGNKNMPIGQIEYYFKVAKALGARGITRELSEDAAKILGPIADKHQIMIGFHNHTQIRPDTYDGSMLSYGKYLGINLDTGHYVAGTNESPIPMIKKFKDRIISLHIKDRKINNGPNMPLGQGDTPVSLMLQLMKKEKMTFPADIELEYKIPENSDPVTEVAKCVEFCKKSLA